MLGFYSRLNRIPVRSGKNTYQAHKVKLKLTMIKIKEEVGLIYVGGGINWTWGWIGIW